MAIRFALAGYMGSGKSTCAALLRERGFAIIDADREAKRLMNEDEALRAALRDEFGTATVGSKVDFAKLGAAVFSSYDRLLRLNEIVHPPLLDSLASLLERTEGDVVLDAALLPIWGKAQWFDMLVWARAPRPARMERVTRRTVLGRMQVAKRMDMQERLMPEPPAPPWHYLTNDSTLEILKRRFETLIAGQPVTGRGHQYRPTQP